MASACCSDIDRFGDSERGFDLNADTSIGGAR